MFRILTFSSTSVALYDGFTTLFGTVLIMDKNGWETIVFSFFTSIIILTFLIATSQIWSEQNGYSRSMLVVRILWTVSFFYDLYTSYVGNLNFLLGGSVNNVQQFFVLVVATVLVSTSPIILSYLLTIREEKYGPI